MASASEVIKLDQIVDRHFKDSRTLYFHSSDAHRAIEGDTYLRYEYMPGPTGLRVALYLGGDNGEICTTVQGDPNKLDLLIKTLIS